MNACSSAVSSSLFCSSSVQIADSFMAVRCWFRVRGSWMWVAAVSSRACLLTWLTQKRSRSPISNSVRCARALFCGAFEFGRELRRGEKREASGLRGRWMASTLSAGSVTSRPPMVLILSILTLKTSSLLGLLAPSPSSPRSSCSCSPP